MSKFRKLTNFGTVFVSLIILPGILFAPSTQAADIISQAQAKLDISITKEDQGFTTPDQIVVVPIFMGNTENSINNTKWYRGLYYYTIQKLGFPDIPFHYVVSSDGDVFAGNSGGDERKVSITGIGNNIMTVAYLSNSLTSTIDPRAETSLKTLLLTICNRNSIKPEKISVKGVKFVKNEEKKSVSMVNQQLFGNWENSVKSIADSIKDSYVPVPKDYSVEVQSVSITTDQVNPGDQVEASIKIKNTGTNGIYGGTNSEILISKATSGVSAFYINNEWLSQTQASIMSEDQVLLPGKEDTYKFQLKAPLYIGDKSEDFELKNPIGSRINSKSFVIKLNLKRPTKQIIEIKNNAAGSVRIFSNAYSTTSIATAASGQRYFLIDDIGNGWISIDLGDGRKGWLANWNVIYI